MTHDEILEQHAIAIRAMQESINAIADTMNTKSDKSDLNECMEKITQAFGKHSELLSMMQAQVEMLRGEVLEMKQAGNSKNL